MPLRRKLALGVMLLGGVFVIVAAIVRICMSLEAEPSTMNINRWGIRETIAGILAVNAPIVRPMISKAFWRGGPMSATDPSQTEDHTAPSKPRSGRNIFRSRRSSSKDIFEMLGPPARSPFYGGAKDNSRSTTIKAFASDGDSERAASDAASEDLIIQKCDSPASGQEQQRRQRTDHGDLERGIPSGSPPSEQFGGISVTTTYSVRPASSQDPQHGVPGFIRAGPMAAELPAELDGSGTSRR